MARDWPHPRTSELAPDERTNDARLRARILVENPRSLYGFEAR